MLVEMFHTESGAYIGFIQGVPTPRWGLTEAYRAAHILLTYQRGPSLPYQSELATLDYRP